MLSPLQIESCPCFSSPLFTGKFLSSSGHWKAFFPPTVPEKDADKATASDWTGFNGICYIVWLREVMFVWARLLCFLWHFKPSSNHCSNSWESEVLLSHCLEHLTPKPRPRPEGVKLEEQHDFIWHGEAMITLPVLAIETQCLFTPEILGIKTAWCLNISLYIYEL